MVYRNYHEECNVDCTRLVAYVRIEGKWTKIGHYGSECKQFEPLDLEKEKQEREQKERLAMIKSKIQQTKQEGRESRRNIAHELNVSESFLREQRKLNQKETS